MRKPLTTAVGCLCCQVEYLAKRLSTLLVMPDSRQALMRLPEPLLRQLLASEAVDVEQVGTLLVPLPVHFSMWVCVENPCACTPDLLRQPLCSEFRALKQLRIKT